MARLFATTANIGTVTAGAVSGDIVEMAAGTYSSLPLKANVTFEAYDWGVGRVVSDTTGHNGTGLGVIVQNVGISTSAAGWTVRGIFLDNRGRTGSFSNTWLIGDGGDGVTIEDCVIADKKNDGNRAIGITPGGHGVGLWVYDFTFRRNRYSTNGQTGQDLDHPLYLKNLNESSAGLKNGFLIEDNILERAGYFPFHCYPSTRNGIIRRNCTFKCGRGVTFSGDTNANNSSVFDGSAQGILFEYNLLSHKNIAGGFHIERYAGGGAPISGNVYQNNCIALSTAAGGTTGTIQTGMTGVSDGGGNITGTNSAGYADPDNGDFRLNSGSFGLGYGPSFIQPNSNVDTTGLVTSVAVVSDHRSTVFFANNPDRVSP